MLHEDFYVILNEAIYYVIKNIKEEKLPVIKVKNLSKSYGDHKAVNNISFEAKSGEILGFLGPNGAGKSTTMNMLTGYISSTSGQAIINGVDIMENPKKAKSFIGYLPEIPPLYLDMTVSGYLNFVFDLKKCKLSRKKHLNEIYELVKITDVKDRIIKHLSKGYKQRVGLAQALIGNPPVLILDEPTVGLDPKQIIEIRTLIKRLGKNHTVILSSHILSEIQAVCDRIIIINKGRLVADGTAENLTNSVTNDHKIIARIEGPREAVYKAVRGIQDVVSVIADMNRGENIYDYEIEAKPGVDIRKTLNKVVSENNWYILMLQPNDLTLEDVFIKIVAGSADVEGTDETSDETSETESEQEAAKEEAIAEENPEKTVDEKDTKPEKKKKTKKEDNGKKGDAE